MHFAFILMVLFCKYNTTQACKTIVPKRGNFNINFIIFWEEIQFDGLGLDFPKLRDKQSEKL